MPNPDPIQQRIEVTADTGGATEVSQSLEQLQGKTEESARAALEAARAGGTLDDQYRGLATTQRTLAEAEDDYQQRLARGEAISDADAAAAAERQAQLRGLSTALAEEAERQRRVNQLIEESAGSTQRAEAAEQTREQRLTEVRRRLTDLVREQDRYERATRAGTAVTRESERAEEERARQIDQLGRELAQEQRVQDRATEAVRRHSAAHDDASAKGSAFGGVVNTMTTRMAGFVTGIVGANGAIRALQMLGEELDRRIEQSRELAEAQLNLQFLGSTFNEQEREFIGKASVAGGRGPAETARAFTQLKSRFPGKSDEELQTLFLEITQTGITTDADLGTLTDAFAGLFAENGDAQRSQNILRETITPAGVTDPGTLSQLLGKFLGPAKEVGNATDAEAAGLVAAATGLDTRAPEEQITGLRSVLLSLLGDLNDEQRATADAAGIDRTSINTALSTLGQAVERGDLDAAALDRLVGAEGISTATALGDPRKRQEFFAKQAAVVQAGDSDRDLTGEAIQQIFKGDDVQALNFAIKQSEAQQAVAESNDADALRSQLARQVQENQLRSSGLGVVERTLAGVTTRALQALGVSDEAATAGPIQGVGLGVQLALPGSAPLLKNFQEERKRDAELIQEKLQSIDVTGFLPGQAPASPEAATNPEAAADPADQQSVLPDATETNALLRELIDEVRRGAANPGDSIDPFAQANGGGRGDTHIHGDVYTNGDPATAGLEEAYRNA